MSLNTAQREATRAELRANLELSGLTVAQVAEGLKLPESDVEEALRLAGASPASVWHVRDFLEDSIEAQGLTAHPYSSLTPQMRSSAVRWFGI